MKAILLLPSIILLAACATQPHQPNEQKQISDAEKQQLLAHIKKQKDQVNRLENVSFKILSNGLQYCQEKEHTGYHLGAQFWTGEMFPSEWRGILQSELNLGKEIQVYQVTSLSAADSAGLKLGDKVIAIDGTQYSSSHDALKFINETVSSGHPVSLTVLRGQEREVIYVKPMVVCKSDVALTTHDSLSTMTDGKVIQITNDLMDFFASDDEIALIVSHQLAHNARKHHTSNAVASFFGGTAVGAFGVVADLAIAVATGGILITPTFTSIGWNAGKAMTGGYSVNQLKLADQDSLFIMTMAGYEINRVSDFWKRVQTFEHPQIANGLRESHPFSDERAVAFETVKNEINAKMDSKNLPYALNY